MGDLRFDRAWEAWEGISPEKRLPFLEEARLEQLVSVLASRQAGENDYERNILASAILNRVRALEGEESPRERVEIAVEESRAMAGAAHALAASARELVARHRQATRASVHTSMPTSRSDRSAAEH